MQVRQPINKGARRSAREYVVCRQEDLPPGRMVIAPVGKFGVGVYNVHGILYAINNYCPHMGGPLCSGNVYGTNLWDDVRGRAEHVLDGRIARCPWHAWEIDVATGVSVADARKRTRTYDVRVENGEVVLTR